MMSVWSRGLLVAAVLGAALVPRRAAPAPAPDWRQPAFPLRVVFTSGAESNVILRLARRGGMPTARQGFYACTPAGAALPFRVVHAGEDDVVLAVRPPVPAGGKPVLVYYGSEGPADGAPCPEAGSDPAPIAAGLYRLPGRAIPSSWERLRHMMQSLGPLRLKASIELFPAIAVLKAEQDRKEDQGRKKENRHRGRRAGQIAVLRSFLLAPAEGVYRFAIDCADAGFVMIDRELAAEWPGAHQAGEWRLGAPVFLKAGLHRIDVYNAFDAPTPVLRVGWVRPERPGITALAAQDLVGSGEPAETRTERIDRTLQPAFTATPLNAYAFRGHAAVFIPVEFKNKTASWIDQGMTCRWTYGDGARGEGNSTIHTYRAFDAFDATLEARDALGFVAACSERVDCRQVNPQEYAVAFDVEGLPAVNYPRDRLSPSLRIKGEVPSSVVLAVEWEWVYREGPAGRGHGQASPAGRPVQLALGQVSAGAVDRLRWRVQHAGVTLADETIRFVTPPFSRVPARVEADTLVDASGARLVLVPDETGGRGKQAPLNSRRGLGRVACVDDTLAPPGATQADLPEPFDRVLARLLDGVADEVRYAPLPAWEQAPGSYGPLRALVDVPAALGADAGAAVLSLGLRDMLAGVDDGAFERKVAALSDLVSGACRVPVVWVTPPPYPSAPDRSRQFAAIIRRVAEARGIPVADLYTAFRCVEGNWYALFRSNPLELSAVGQRLAAQQEARALVGGERP